MNPWKVFQGMIPAQPLQVAQVLSHESGNRSRVELPTGQTMLVIGQTVAAGNWAYIRGGKVESQAPDLAVVEVTV